MHLWKAGDVVKVDEYLDDKGLRRNTLFHQFLQALIELADAGTEERALLESISNHVTSKGGTDQLSFTFFLDDLINITTAKTLLVLDRGFYDFGFFLRLIAKQVDFITRIKSNAAFDVEQILSYDYALRDRVISFNTEDKHQKTLRLRLIEVKQGKTWYAYITSVLDPQILPPYVVADLYARRWRIEEAFNTAKRLLGLSYLWTGSINGVKLQVWATWLLYSVLIDLADAVADELALPFDRISLEMIFRGLYHFNHAYNKGRATDPVLFFTSSENKNLDIVKTIRKKPQTLDLSPFPLPLTIPAFP